jgi:phage head maturation protease
MPNNTRQIGPLSRRAAVSTINAEKRTVDLVWTTGARVLRSSWYDGPFYEELSLDPKHVRMGRLNNGAPFLADHNGSRVADTLGVVVSARLEGDQGVATVRFAAEGIDPEADKIFRKIADGIVQNVSVGYRTYKTEKTEGVDSKIPTLRAVDWEPYELSVVAIGADDSAGFRSAEQTNDVEIISRSIPPRVNHEEQTTMTEEEKKRLEAEALAQRQAAQRQAEETTKRELEIKNGAMQLERERQSGIRSAVKAAKLGDTVAEKLLADGVSLTDARAFVLEELAKRDASTAIGAPIGSGIEVGESDREKFIRGATAGLLARSGVLMTLSAASDKIQKSSAPGVRAAFRGFDFNEDGGEFRNFSLLDLARESLERQGVKTRGMSPLDVAGAAMTMRAAGAGASSSDFAVLIENIMYKSMLGAYAQAADTWRRFCGTDSVQDFRPSNRYRTGSFGVLDTLLEDSEYKQKSIPDGLKFAITTETRGNKIAISRQAIVNDDMGAITDTMSKFGRSAGLSIEKSVYDLILLNAGLGPSVTLGSVTQPLFNAAWGNVGTGAALSMASIESDRVLMAQQKDISNNEYLDLRPAVLLIPLGLEGDANAINRAKFDPTSASAFERPNIVGGLFRDVVGTPRLTGTRRYMFTDPSEAAAIKVVFLNGSQAPFLDQQQGWNVDGVEMKLRIDFKAQAFDPKGAITNAGV